MYRLYVSILLFIFGVETGKIYGVDVTLLPIDEYTSRTPSFNAAESSLSQVLTEVTRAEQSHEVVNVGRLKMSEFAKRSLARMWAVTPFTCPDEEIVEKCWVMKNGTMLVRHIPLLIKPEGETFGMNHFQEAVVEFDKNGTITDFRLTISPQQEQDIDKCGVKDVEKQHIIKKQLEQFRTAYNQKDIETIDAMFSNDALIITGKVVRRRTSNEMFPTSSKVEYTRLTKQQYIANLKKAFARNKWIDVKFEIPTSGIVKGCDWLTSSKRKDENGNPLPFYGVRLIQKWKSSNYHDEGYLFLLWEFPQNGGEPIIHVRTWQPLEVDGVIQEPDDDISTLGGFNL